MGTGCAKAVDHLILSGQDTYDVDFVPESLEAREER